MHRIFRVTDRGGAMGPIAIQVILNVAVVTNTIPNTGITLPFISYGGTSVLFLLSEMGLVLAVSRWQSEKNAYDNFIEAISRLE